MMVSFFFLVCGVGGGIERSVIFLYLLNDAITIRNDAINQKTTQ
jgi:hypothetical protein